MKYQDYYITIGLEIHVALMTKEKLFSSSANGFQGNEFELLDAGIPGVLPVLDKSAVAQAIAFGKTVNAQIEKESIFERKHYFYPDLPLGYQITQQHNPILTGGEVKIVNEEGVEVIVKIEHAHLECDAAKSIHDLYSQYTAIDLSRAASPLLEIVSLPCISSPYEAKEYARKVYSMVTFLEICDGKIEEGSFRVDASISLSKVKGKLGTRVEIKNISSFGFLEQALNFEMQRQAYVLDSGKSLIMETRLWDEKSQETKSMRVKETVDEYRYMPCPDIAPLIISENFIKEVLSSYDTKYEEYIEKFAQLFKKHDILWDDKMFSQYWSPYLKHIWKFIWDNETYQTQRSIKLIAFWLSPLLEKILSLEDFILLYQSGLEAKEIKEAVMKSQSENKELKDCLPVFSSNEEVLKIIELSLKDYPKEIEKYKSGETKILQFLMGKMLKELKGTATASQVKDILIEKLN